MITGTKEELDKIVQTHQCLEHGPKLVVAWHAKENSYVVRCGDGHYPEEITGVLSPTAEWKGGKREAIDNTFNLLPRADLETGELIPPEMVQALIAYAKKYDLDAYRGHVVIMHGKPYIGIDGYLYHANQTNVPYKLVSRPLTKDERETYKIGVEDHAWLAEVTRLISGATFTGLGIVTQAEMTEMSKRRPGQLRSPVVAKHPWQQAQKRAEWQALRRAFPIGETEEE